MASSTFTFVDQNGNPVWGLATRISRDQGDTTKAEDERYPDRSGKTTFLEVKKVLPAQNGHTLHINYNEGLNPNWADYLPLSKYFSDIEDPNQIKPAIVIERKGTNPNPVPPGNLTEVTCIYGSTIKGLGTPEEWKAITHAIVDKLPPGAIMEPDSQHGGNGQQPNMRFVHNELLKIHPWSGLQLSGGGELKPRVFAVSNLHDGKGPPESQCGQYSRPFDIGSFGKPFFHSSDGSTDVWQQTGRPPGSKW